MISNAYAQLLEGGISEMPPEVALLQSVASDASQSLNETKGSDYRGWLFAATAILFVVVMPVTSLCVFIQNSGPAQPQPAIEPAVPAQPAQ